MEFLRISICLVIIIHVLLAGIVAHDVVANSKRPFRMLWALLILFVPFFGARFYFQTMKRKKRPAHLKQLVDMTLWGVKEPKYDKSFRPLRMMDRQQMFY